MHIIIWIWTVPSFIGRYIFIYLHFLLFFRSHIYSFHRAQNRFFCLSSILSSEDKWFLLEYWSFFCSSTFFTICFNNTMSNVIGLVRLLTNMGFHLPNWFQLIRPRTFHVVKTYIPITYWFWILFTFLFFVINYRPVLNNPFNYSSKNYWYALCTLSSYVYVPQVVQKLFSYLYTFSTGSR